MTKQRTPERQRDALMLEYKELTAALERHQRENNLLLQRITHLQRRHLALLADAEAFERKSHVLENENLRLRGEL